MKIVKTYETFIGKETPSEFDVDFAAAKIKHLYSELEVKEMFDNELPNWIEESEISDYEDVYDWFYDLKSDHSKKRQIAFAISEIVVDQLMDWYEKEFNQSLSDEDREILAERIIKHYDGIDPNNW